MLNNIAFNHTNSTLPNTAMRNQFLEPATKRKILIVDDNQDLVRLLVFALKELEHDVRMANNGLLAIEIAHEFVPDVVMLDIEMLGIDGYETCRLMREDPKLKDTLFIAQSAWGTLEDRRFCKHAGFHYYLLKPFNLDSLELLMENKDEYIKSS